MPAGGTRGRGATCKWHVHVRGRVGVEGGVTGVGELHEVACAWLAFVRAGGRVATCVKHTHRRTCTGVLVLGAGWVGGHGGAAARCLSEVQQLVLCACVEGAAREACPAPGAACRAGAGWLGCAEAGPADQAYGLFGERS